MPFISIYVIYAWASVLFHRQRILESLRNLLEPRPSSRTFTPRCSPDALKLTSSSLALELFLADLHKRMRWYFTRSVFDVFGSVFARHALEAFRVYSGEMLQDAQWIVEHGHFAVTLLQCLVTKPMQRKVRKWSLMWSEPFVYPESKPSKPSIKIFSAPEDPAFNAASFISRRCCSELSFPWSQNF
jgi:hypothetical protein